MKNRFLKSLAFLVVSFWMANVVSAQTKIATVNLQKVYERYWKSKQISSQIEKKASEFDTQRNQLMATYEKANEEFKKILDSADDPALPDSERSKRKQVADTKLRELQTMEAQAKKLDTTARETIGKEQLSMIEAVLTDIQDAVKTKATAAGYDIVWDSSARSGNGTPLILFNNPQKDLSDEVLTLLNKNAPPSSAPAMEKK